MIEGDLCDTRILDQAFEREGFDAIVHLAAWAGVRPSIERPDIYVSSNIRGTTLLLERARHVEGLRFVFASSSSVYGGRSEIPFRETDEVDRPISPYAATKKAGEVLCYTWHHLYGMPVSALRFFTASRGHHADFINCVLTRGEPKAPAYANGSDITVLKKGFEIKLEGAAQPHIHRGYETAIYILEGQVQTFFGPGLSQSTVNEAGDFLFIARIEFPDLDIGKQPFDILVGKLRAFDTR